ncbi:uncharacterized protein LOC143067244 isoform X2 [Mytilus galloprovincialis]|uniref:uncharacterized protein LOC143067244 isoform X2 n=1 Tax=Mytilus galloprovincialis TaxID=29158 RepID=UPI003F7CBE9A
MSYPVDKPCGGPFKSKRDEHLTAKCEGVKTNGHLCSSDNSTASSASYASFKAPNQVHTNPNFVGDNGERRSYADVNSPTTSINSDYDDPTTTEFMLQPGIHVPSNMKVTSSYSTFDNNEFKLNDENDEESEPDQTSNSSRHDRITWPEIVRPTVDEVLNSITLDNNDVKLNDNNVAGCNPHQELDPRVHVYLPSVPDDVSIQGSSYFKSQKKKYNWRKWIIIIFVCSCLSVVAALIVQNEYGM